MHKLLVWIFLTFAVRGLCQSPADGDEATAAIGRLREGLVSSFKKGDIEGLLTHLDPNVIVTWQNGEVCHGPAEVRAFYARTMTGPNPVVRAIQSEPQVLGRQVYGDWAVSWGNLHDHFVLNDGSDLPFNSVFTATIAKRGDRWLVTAFHTSVSAFGNPVVALAARKTALWAGLAGGVFGVLLGIAGAQLLRRKAKSV
jgi:ketosteroid isomerase-like protein